MDNTQNEQESAPSDLAANLPGQVINPSNVNPVNIQPPAPNLEAPLTVTQPPEAPLNYVAPQPEQNVQNAYVQNQADNNIQSSAPSLEVPLEVPAPPENNIQPPAPPPELSPQVPMPSENAYNENNNFQFQADETDQSQNFVADEQYEADDGNNINWVGPEFVEHEKNATWYLTLIATGVALGGLIFFLTKDVINGSVIVLAILALGFYGLRHPKNIQYSLSNHNIAIGTKNFSYSSFKAFTAIMDGEYISVTFIPLKRFAAPAGICMSKNDESGVVDFLSTKLPLERHQPDLIERLMMRISF